MTFVINVATSLVIAVVSIAFCFMAVTVSLIVWEIYKNIKDEK